MTCNVRTPTILQVEAVECGAAALAMVLAFHGRWIPLSDLRVECGVSRDGSKAANLLKCARRHGLVASGKRLELPRLAEMVLPVIVFVNLNHFVVLEAIGRRGYRLNDPAVGRRWVSDDEFDVMFTGVTLLFTPGPKFRKTTPPRSAVWNVARLLGRAPSGVGLILVAGLSLVATGIVLPAFLKVFVDDVLMAGQTDWLWGLGLAMAAVVCLQGALTWMRGLHQARLQTQLASGLCARLAWTLVRLPIPFFGQRLAGALASRGDMAAQIATLGAETLLSAVLGAVSVVFFLLVMALYNPTMAGVVIVLMVGNAVVLLAVQQRMKQSSIKMASEMMNLQGKTFIGLQSIESIKSSGTEDRFFEGWSGTHAHLVNAQGNIAVQQALTTSIPEFTSLLAKAATLVVGGLMVMDGALTLGTLVAFLALLTALDGPARMLVDDVQKLIKTQGPLTQIEDVVDYPIAAEFSPARSHAGPAPRLVGAIDIKGLTFGFSPLAPPLISNFDLTVRAGQSVALVGASGSGKSTIGKLLTGLYPACSGKILFDGQPIEDIDRDILRSSISVVDQKIVLFEDSFRENIRLWDETINDRDVIEAARDAQIHDMIAATEHGYDTIVQEAGRNMSGGQRQRLEIARALARQASILVLDEATSALDPIVEHRIMDTIRGRDCTCVVIAHRLSTIRDCDEIIVLDRGQIAQRGCHEEMTSQAGPYRALLEA